MNVDLSSPQNLRLTWIKLSEHFENKIQEEKFEDVLLVLSTEIFELFGILVDIIVDQGNLFG